MSENNLFHQLRAQVEKELDICSAAETPVVCAAAHDPQNREAVIKMVLTKVIEANTTIREAIIAIDNEYDINSID